MQYAWSVRYAMLVNALDSKTDYDDYLHLGLRCPKKGCAARVFFVAGSDRREHQRMLKSGKTVSVKASNPQPHFACFDMNDCRRGCRGKENNLSEKEIVSLDSAGRNQRLKRIQGHFLEMYDRSQTVVKVPDISMTDELITTHIKNYGLIEEQIEAMTEASIAVFRNSPDLVKQKCDYMVDALLNMRPQDLKKMVDGWRERSTSHFQQVDQWLKGLEIDLHKQLTRESVDFLCQKKQMPVLRSVVLRAILSYIAYVEATGENCSLQEIPYKIIETLVGALSTVRWAENWEKQELNRLTSKV